MSENDALPEWVETDDVTQREGSLGVGPLLISGRFILRSVVTKVQSTGSVLRPLP